MSTSKEFDAVLIEKVKRGDTQAFRELVDKYKNVSLSLAYSVLKDKAKAEDVLQEVFMKVFHKANSFKHQSAFSTWLYRIVVNTSFNELKWTKDHQNLEVIELHQLKDKEKSGFENLKEEDQKKYVVLALNRLKVDEALVLRLFYLCDMNVKEIGDITGFNTSKIKVDLHRGRKSLEIALKNLLGNQVGDLL